MRLDQRHWRKPWTTAASPFSDVKYLYCSRGVCKSLAVTWLAGCVLWPSSVHLWQSLSLWLGIASLCSPQRWWTLLTRPTPPGRWARLNHLIQIYVPLRKPAIKDCGPECWEILTPYFYSRPGKTSTTLTSAMWWDCVGPYWMDPSCQRCKWRVSAPPLIWGTLFVLRVFHVSPPEHFKR